jgi:hypothetical protein
MTDAGIAKPVSFRTAAENGTLAARSAEFVFDQRLQFEQIHLMLGVNFHAFT